MRQVRDEAGSWWRARDARPQSPPASRQTFSHSDSESQFSKAHDTSADVAQQRAPQSGGWILFCGLSALALTVVFILLGGYGRPAATNGTLWRAVDRLAALTGLAIDQVSLSGHHMTDETAVFDALDLANASSIARFNAEEARSRIERLPWVASAQISLSFPNSMDIRLSERSAYAVWRRGDEDFLIDTRGRVLSPLPQGRARTLPLVAGEGAADNASIILATVARFPAVSERFELAERVGGRRWSLRLRDGIVLHLPPDREAPALAQFLDGEAGRIALAQGHQTIDLRADGRMTLRPGAIREPSSHGGF